MKKPVYRVINNPGNIVGTSRFVKSKYAIVKCHCCGGVGRTLTPDSMLVVHVLPEAMLSTQTCWLCMGYGKISLRRL